MSETKIVHLFGVEGGKLLLVFHSARRCYGFRLVTDWGEVMGEEKIYCTVEAALREGWKELGISDRL